MIHKKKHGIHPFRKKKRFLGSQFNEGGARVGGGERKEKKGRKEKKRRWKGRPPHCIQSRYFNRRDGLKNIIKRNNTLTFSPSRILNPYLPGFVRHSFFSLFSFPKVALVGDGWGIFLPSFKMATTLEEIFIWLSTGLAWPDGMYSVFTALLRVRR